MKFTIQRTQGLGMHAGEVAEAEQPAHQPVVVLDRQEKYKAKNIIDTVIYRSGDVVSAWAYAGLQALGLGLAAIALLAVPLTGLWAWICFRLGRRQQALAKQLEVP